MLVSSRSYAEYEAMFDLGERPQRGLVVDCCAGASSFNAELADLGGTALAIDPAYALERRRLAESVAASWRGGSQIIGDHADRFVWSWYGTPEHRNHLRTRAAARFLDDIAARPRSYVAARLPHLPVQTGAARLVLCSHLLFTWADRLDADWHRAALSEMARITHGEVRVFPLVVHSTGDPVPFLGQVLDGLERDGFDVSLRNVPYEFQPGAHTMLVIGQPARTPR